MPYNNFSSNKQMLPDEKGFTLIELLIIAIICGIGAVFLIGLSSGNSILPSKQQCLNAGGKWSEGIQYGRMTQLCTYN